MESWGLSAMTVYWPITISIYRSASKPRMPRRFPGKAGREPPTTARPLGSTAVLHQSHDSDPENLNPEAIDVCSLGSPFHSLGSSCAFNGKPSTPTLL